MALCFIEPELIANGSFTSCSCDLDLDPMTLIYEYGPYFVEIYRMCKYELPTLRHSKVIV